MDFDPEEIIMEALGQSTHQEIYDQWYKNIQDKMMEREGSWQDKFGKPQFFEPITMHPHLDKVDRNGKENGLKQI